MLLAEGASVGLFDVVPQEKGDAIAKELSSDGKALYVRVDITDDQAVKAAVQQVVDKFGNLKGCVHCAGTALKRDWTNDAAESIPNFRKVSRLLTRGDMS
jgi:NAD(P)-dependent dehydrogenase (short-subunit alcohol dehydrogenase family)